MEQDLNVKIGRRIAALRRKKQLSQAELGKIICVSDKTVSKWEQGHGAPEINSLVAVSDFFGVSLDYLVKGTDRNEVPKRNWFERAIYFAQKDDSEAFMQQIFPYFESGQFNFPTYRKENPHELWMDLFINSQQIFTAFGESHVEFVPRTQKSKDEYGEKEPSKYKDAFFELFCQVVTSNNSSRVFKACFDKKPEFWRALYDADKKAYLKMCVLSGCVEALTRCEVTVWNEDELHYLFSLPETEKPYFDFMLSLAPAERECERNRSSVITRNYERDLPFSKERIHNAQHVALALYRSGRTEELEKYLSCLKQVLKSFFEWRSIERVDYWENFYRMADRNKICNGYGYANGDLLYNGIRVPRFKEDFVLSVIQKEDKLWGERFVSFNRYVQNLCSPQVSSWFFAPTDEELKVLFQTTKKENRAARIRADERLSVKERHARLLDTGVFPALEEILMADDYDSFERLPEELKLVRRGVPDSDGILHPEWTHINFTDLVLRDCKDVRFYKYVASLEKNCVDLNDALRAVLEKAPERKDILRVLLDAGAIFNEDLAQTNLLRMTLL